MQTLIHHSRSGETILGVQLLPGATIGENDLYDSSDGRWRTADLAVGGKVPLGDRVVWVRQPGQLSENARTLLRHLASRPWGENTCIGYRNHSYYIIPSPTFNWDRRIEIEAMRVVYPECVHELIDHGYLVAGTHVAISWVSEYSTVRKNHENEIYTLTDEGKQHGEKILN